MSLFRRKRDQRIRFDGSYSNWSEALAKCSCYDAVHILDKVLDATRKVKCGEAVFERDSVIFDHIEYAWPVLSGLLWAAARNGGDLNVLDYGGALGSSYFQNQKFFSGLSKLRWNVVEQLHYAEAGRKYIQDEQLRFYKTIEECLLENQPNVVLLSSVLQYVPDPFNCILRLLAFKPDILIIDRTSYHNDGDISSIKIQHVPASIYSASYPCWFFAENEVIKCIVDAGYLCVESFAALDKLDERATWKGHIFSKLKHI